MSALLAFTRRAWTLIGMAAPGDPPLVDVALGITARGVRMTIDIGRTAVTPARWAARAPLVRPLVRRVEADLAHAGRLERASAVARIEQVVATEAFARAVDHVLAGPFTDALAHSVAANQVVERLAAEIVRTADLDGVLDAVLEDVRTERLLERALENPGMQRLVIRVLESRLVDALTEQVLASPELERVVDYVASSPQVREAVTRQTQSFAEEMAAGVRTRTQSVDERAERTVRGWLHRPRPQPS